MGCFEITSKFYGAQYPITVLFRRPKMRWLHALKESGRTNQKINLATANMQGVHLLKKRGDRALAFIKQTFLLLIFVEI